MSKQRRSGGVMDGILDAQRQVNVLESRRVDRPGPTCSRCLRALVWVDDDVAPLTLAVIGGDNRHAMLCVGTEEAPVCKGHWSCPDHCASVAERWRLAADRFACGWVEYRHECTRCGTNLMGPPDDWEHAVGGYWCPGCGSVVELEMWENWLRGRGDGSEKSRSYTTG